MHGFNTWGRESRKKDWTEGTTSCTIILENYKHLGPTTPSLFSRTPCSWDSHIAHFMAWANQPTKSAHGHILPWVTSLCTQIGWPGKLPKALPMDRISSHCPSRTPLSEEELLWLLVCSFHSYTKLTSPWTMLGGSFPLMDHEGSPRSIMLKGKLLLWNSGGWHVGLS